jgi:hypothetical protein
MDRRTIPCRLYAVACDPLWWLALACLGVLGIGSRDALLAVPCASAAIERT